MRYAAVFSVSEPVGEREVGQGRGGDEAGPAVRDDDDGVAGVAFGSDDVAERGDVGVEGLDGGLAVVNGEEGLRDAAGVAVGVELVDQGIVDGGGVPGAGEED